MLCRLVDGVRLNAAVINASFVNNFPDPDIRQYEQQVMEVAAQLLQVCLCLCLVMFEGIAGVMEHCSRTLTHVILCRQCTAFTSSNLVLCNEGYQPRD